MTDFNDENREQASVIPPITEVEDESKDFIEDEKIVYRNLCSWLLVFTPKELVIVSVVLAILITRDLTIEEQAVVGTFLTALADNIFLISAQAALIREAIDERKEIEDKRKEKEAMKEAEAEKTKWQNQLKQNEEEIKSLKTEIKDLKELVKKQLRV